MQYTIKELALKSGMKVETLRGILKRNKVKPLGTVLIKKHKEYVYSFPEFKRAVKDKIKVVEIPTFYNQKVTEIYHIYESKMNYIDDL